MSTIIILGAAILGFSIGCTAMKYFVVRPLKNKHRKQVREANEMLAHIMLLTVSGKTKKKNKDEPIMSPLQVD